MDDKNSLFQEVANHSKQSSLGDEDEALLNIKPMEPLLRGYKRGIIFPRRLSSNAYIGLSFLIL